MTVHAEIFLQLKAILDSAPPYVNGAAVLEQIATNLFTGTTDSTQVDRLYWARVAPGAGATSAIDLKTALDANGNALALVDLDTIAFFDPGALGKSEGANDDGVNIGPSAANGLTGPWVDASDRINLPPNGWWMARKPGGWTVDNTHKSIDLINLDAGDTSYIFVLVLGRSA